MAVYGPINGHLWAYIRGVSAQHAEVLLFRQKDPKPLAPRRGPSGAFALVPTVWAAELASLRQSSPPYRLRDRGAATPAGARDLAPWGGGGTNTKGEGASPSRPSAPRRPDSGQAGADRCA